MEKIPCVVIGGGVIGLACARSMTKYGISTYFLERNSSFGQETSSRNSEVLHAGLYYHPESLKGRFCVQGRKFLHDYLLERNISHNICGKLIVASGESDIPKLKSILANAEHNGVKDLRILKSKQEIHEYEKEVEGQMAIYSPSTGIFDSHSYMLNLLSDIENSSSDSQVIFNCEVFKLECFSSPLNSSNKTLSSSSFFRIHTSQGVVESSYVINCAGHNATFLAKTLCPPSSLPSSSPSISSFSSFDPLSLSSDSITLPNHNPLHPPPPPPRLFLSHQWVPSIYFAKGNYFKLDASIPTPFSHLIYPTPQVGGLGVHLTLDMEGRARFGPDVQWMREEKGKEEEKRHERVKKEEEGIEEEGKEEEGKEKNDIDYEFHRPLISSSSSSSSVSLYQVDSSSSLLSQFQSEISKYWPHFPLHTPLPLPSVTSSLSYLSSISLSPSLIPDYAGIRPKLHGPYCTPLPNPYYPLHSSSSSSSSISSSSPTLYTRNPPSPSSSSCSSSSSINYSGYSDFLIDGFPTHGMKGLVNCFGIESPGLTCSLKIGDYVRDLLLKS